MFNGKIHYFHGHFPVSYVKLPEGTNHCHSSWVSWETCQLANSPLMLTSTELESHPCPLDWWNLHVCCDLFVSLKQKRAMISNFKSMSSYIYIHTHIHTHTHIHVRIRRSCFHVFTPSHLLISLSPPELTSRHSKCKFRPRSSWKDVWRDHVVFDISLCIHIYIDR